MLEQQQIRERGLGALNLGGENRLLAGERVDELVGVGEQQRDPVEASQRLVTPDPTPEQLARWRSRPTSVHPLVWTHRSGRRSLVLGASAWLRHVRARPEKGSAWVKGVLARRPVRVAVVAQAAKTARILWAVLTSGQAYRAPAEA